LHVFCVPLFLKRDPAGPKGDAFHITNLNVERRGSVPLTKEDASRFDRNAGGGIPMTKLLLILLIFSRGILVGQIRPDDAVGQAVPASFPGTGTVPIGIDSVSSALDSLELVMLELDIQKAQEKAQQTSFWRRIIPQIHVSASFGVHDVLSIDPMTYVPYVIPKDAYRLTIGFSLNSVLNSGEHAVALLDLEKLNTAYEYRRLEQVNVRGIIELQSAAIEEELKKLDQEERLQEQIVQFMQTKFDLGKAEFDALTRMKLELLTTQKTILRLLHQRHQLLLKQQGEIQK